MQQDRNAKKLKSSAEIMFIDIEVKHKNEAENLTKTICSEQEWKKKQKTRNK
jgi:hypothetical protein